MTAVVTQQITTAVSALTSTPVTGLGTPQACTLQAVFTYVASAGTSVDVYVQTSLDGGTTWYDIANFHFTTASAASYLNCNADTAVNSGVTLTTGTLANNTSINGILGDRLRTYINSVGTYGAGTQVTVTAFSRG